MSESIYLASQSPRRRELLEQIGIEFEVLRAEIDETPLDNEAAGDYVKRLAIEKAKAGQAIAMANKPVLGADTIVVLDDQLLGVMLSCVSPENYEKNLKELKNLNVPFGFKLNGFMTTKPKGGYTSSYFKNSGGNPNKFLGQRHDLTPDVIGKIASKFKKNGATILGGCCETRPAHIKAMAQLK